MSSRTIKRVARKSTGGIWFWEFEPSEPEFKLILPETNEPMLYLPDTAGGSRRLYHDWVYRRGIWQPGHANARPHPWLLSGLVRQLNLVCLDWHQAFLHELETFSSESDDHTYRVSVDSTWMQSLNINPYSRGGREPRSENPWQYFNVKEVRWGSSFIGSVPGVNHEFPCHPQIRAGFKGYGILEHRPRVGNFRQDGLLVFQARYPNAQKVSFGEALAAFRDEPGTVKKWPKRPPRRVWSKKQREARIATRVRKMAFQAQVVLD